MKTMEKESLIRKNGNVQFITHYTECYSYLDAARIALEGGCRWIQLRMKDAPLEEVESTARQVRQLCQQQGALFIIDDHVELAKIYADGVHLGKMDMPIADARCILGETYIIGGTANSFEDVRQHYEAGADYIGCGPFRYTTTKKNLSPILGTDGYADIVRRMEASHISLPIVAIGGIMPDDIKEIMQTGVTGIALSGSVLRAKNPIEEMKRTVAEANRTINHCK
ncbi:thiamine phosphate synthase [Bacteroides helcogenes]|uniref:Thiamine-phosphate synthase n=1 Tax=Bacteroides helcogenes (strain ATCC 35417 / DSM 20613 / JCM 6297 / CCUG 15421 / P 36-108) TaxID=693979 RepID=E6SU56_BACT6|nr:thiamine phosphate synthase [Bacteroides helcogenes]ADV44329.1 thiamine-phosphate diphosphorylase [Bacteroides helcogenes P 36-108]MDY5238262.1 thiamine phosphate synthase [Bacteroides helcogenes]